MVQFRNPEYEETERKGIKSIILPKLVGEIGRLKVIAIAGTHGKLLLQH